MLAPPKWKSHWHWEAFPRLDTERFYVDVVFEQQPLADTVAKHVGGLKAKSEAA